MLDFVRVQRKCPVCQKETSTDAWVEMTLANEENGDGRGPVQVGAFRSSSKIDVLVRELRTIAAGDATAGRSTPTKSVVFSQFTSMLNLVEVRDTTVLVLSSSHGEIAVDCAQTSWHRVHEAGWNHVAA
jgi:hypothetical protein